AARDLPGAAGSRSPGRPLTAPDATRPETVSTASAEPAPAEPVAEAPTALWTPAYVLLCLSFFFMTGNGSLLTPTLPLYFHSVGGSSAFIGLLLVLFAVVSVGSRPIIGHWSDTRGVVGVLLLGILILAVAGLAYLIPLLWLLAIVS